MMIIISKVDIMSSEKLIAKDREEIGVVLF